MEFEFEVTHGGVTLHGTVRGPEDAEPVLLVHGACVDEGFFAAAADVLARRYRVATYDRRGYGRSTLPADTDCSVEAQATDAAAVVAAVLVGGPTHVVAHSGGCVMAMELAAKQPGLVRRLVLDEPLFYDCCPEDGAFAATSRRVRTALEQGRRSLALHLFMTTLGPADPRSQAPTTPTERDRANWDHFIRHEYLALSTYVPDYGAVGRADAVVLLSEMDHGAQYPECATELARRIGAPLLYVPGTHNFPSDLPEEFARIVAGTLAL